MRAARRDTTQTDIVAALRDAGYLVWVLDQPADLLVQRRDGTKELLEVKGPKGRYTAKQMETRAAGWVIPTVRSVEDAFEALS